VADRIQKILSSFGVTSRRTAEQWIKEGRVTCNGVVCELGQCADPVTDVILVDGKPLPVKNKQVYILLHKPKGYVTTLFGRRRPIPELSSGNFMQRSFGERVAMNSPIQGTAADIMKIAMIHVEKALREADVDARIVLQVHDELLVECAEKDAEKVKAILHDEMAKAADVKVPLEVEVEEGSNWFEAH
jgi:hypothetical protein